MTRLLLAACVLSLAACNTPSNEATPPAPSATEVPAKHDYGVKAGYSTDFGLADASLGDKVISMWRYFDNNTLDSSSTLFADSVNNDLPGFSGTLSRDSLIANVKAMRSELSSCLSEVDAIVPLKASNKEESLVCIWGKETVVAAGKKSVRDIQEVWGFNKDGKITWIKQYELKR